MDDPQDATTEPQVPDLVAAGTLANPDAALVRAAATARELMDAKLSPGTRSTYERAFNGFSLWCGDNGFQDAPADVASVVAYLGHLSAEGRSPSRLNVIAAAISWTHRRRDTDDPTTDWRVRDLLSGARNRDAKRVKRRARALLAKDEEHPDVAGEIAAIIAAIHGDDLAALRDRAILLLGFEGGFRRSELAALTLGDLSMTQRGMLITPRMSKTDQAGEGTVVKFIASGSPADIAVKAWRAALESVTGREALIKTMAEPSKAETLRADLPLFVGLHRPKVKTRAKDGTPISFVHTPRDAAISGKSISEIVKERVRLAGLDAGHVSGHSLRSGFVTSALAAGADLFDVMGQTGHKSVQSLAGYVRRANATKRMGGKSLLE